MSGQHCQKISSLVKLIHSSFVGYIINILKTDEISKTCKHLLEKMKHISFNEYIKNCNFQVFLLLAFLISLIIYIYEWLLHINNYIKFDKYYIINDQNSVI